MAYEFSDQQIKLSSLLGDSNTGTDDPWPLSVRKKELNRGELQFAKDSHDLQEYATGVVASGEIAMPDDWMETFLLVVDDRVITADREISIKDYERYYNWAGTPPFYYYWMFSGTRKIKFFGNVNGKTYKLYYFKKPTTELDADGDESLHADEYREAACFYAAGELLQQAGKNQQADRYFVRYEKLVRDAMRQVEKHFLDKGYAVPDVNYVSGNAETDIQGGGFQ